MRLLFFIAIWLCNYAVADPEGAHASPISNNFMSDNLYL